MLFEALLLGEVPWGEREPMQDGANMSYITEECKKDPPCGLPQPPETAAGGMRKRVTGDPIVEWH